MHVKHAVSADRLKVLILATLHFRSLACLWLLKLTHALIPSRISRTSPRANGASPSRSLHEGFAQLLDKWMRHPEHRIRLKRINRMGHLCNFLLDILCIFGVHGMTFCIARLHSLSTFFVDYLRIDPHLDMDRMLQNRKGISAGYRMAGKYLAIIQPFSALFSNVKFRSRHNMHTNMQPCLELLREWEACLMMEDIALTIRSSIALLESINSYVHMLLMPRSAHFLQWSDRHHELAELADEWTQCMPSPSQPEPAQLQLFRQACPSPLRNAMHRTASGSRPTIFTIKHAKQPTCAACQIARGIRIKSMRRRLVQTVFPNLTLHALKTRTQGVDTPRHADIDLLT